MNLPYLSPLFGKFGTAGNPRLTAFMLNPNDYIVENPIFIYGSTKRPIVQDYTSKIYSD